MSEHAELGDVATEKEGHRPVGDDAKLPGEQRELVQVVGAGHEPAGETVQPQPENSLPPMGDVEKGRVLLCSAVPHVK